jgi:hypothetical protein
MEAHPLDSRLKISISGQAIVNFAKCARDNQHLSVVCRARNKRVCYRKNTLAREIDARYERRSIA